MNRTEAAQLRATISSFLSNHSGPHTTEEIVAQVGYNAHTVGQILGGMERNDLIPPHGTSGKKKTWRWAGPATADAPAIPPAPKPTPTLPTPAKEIELVYNGVLILVGRNEKTGRLRLVIEES